MHVVGLLGFLALVSFYLAKRPSDEKTENAALRDRIASLTANCPVECG
jgi:hypothetical protein